MKSVIALILAFLGAGCASLTVTVRADAPPPAYTITGLGNLGTGRSGESLSDALAINRSGQVAGMSTTYDALGQYKESVAFLYSHGKMINLGSSGPRNLGHANVISVALNAAGQVIGNCQGFDDPAKITDMEAYLYSAGSPFPIGTLAQGTTFQGDSTARGINDKGQVVGQSTIYDTPNHFTLSSAFLYSQGRMISLCGPSTLANTTTSDALAINNAGQVVGSYDLSGKGGYLGRNAFLYDDGTLTDLGNLGVDRRGYGTSVATAINQSGQIIGISDVYEAGVDHGRGAFLYTGGQMISLGNFGRNAEGQSVSIPAALNDAGQVVGFSDVFEADGTPRGWTAFLYTGGRLINLGTLGVDRDGVGHSKALAINNAGQVIGLSDYRPFLYADGHLYDLSNLIVNGQDWQGLTVSGINDAGQIIGRGGHRVPGHFTVNQEAFLLTPVRPLASGGVVAPFIPTEAPSVPTGKPARAVTPAQVIALCAHLRQHPDVAAVDYQPNTAGVVDVTLHSGVSDALALQIAGRIRRYMIHAYPVIEATILGQINIHQPALAGQQGGVVAMVKQGISGATDTGWHVAVDQGGNIKIIE